MRIIETFLFILVLLFLVNGISDNSTTEILTKLENVENNTFGLTKIFNYTSLYNETNINTQNILFNIINPLVYTIVVEINTMLPVVIYAAANPGSRTTINVVIAIVIIWLIIKIPIILKSLIAIWFFFKEKKKYNEKIWE